MWIPLDISSPRVKCSYCGQKFDNVLLSDNRLKTSEPPVVEWFYYCPKCGRKNWDWRDE